MIDAAVNVALLLGLDGALEPELRRGELNRCATGSSRPGSGSSRSLVIGVVMNALLLGGDGTLEPGRAAANLPTTFKAPPTTSPFSSKISRPGPFQLSSSTG